MLHDEFEQEALEMATVEVSWLEMVHATVAATGRSPEIPPEDDVYGWLVGSWELEVKRYWSVDVSVQRIMGEVHAAWTLEGRAVQDVWIMPPRDRRPAKRNPKLNMYGTTFRAWDSSIHAWRIMWSNPAGDHFENQIGRRSDGDVVQSGTRPDGSLTRWRFIEITGDSFHWLGESRAHNGESWTVEGEFLARRTC